MNIRERAPGHTRSKVPFGIVAFTAKRSPPSSRGSKK